jgi:acylphosphatase
MEEKVRYHVYVSGKVQGVFFRDQTRQQAERWGVSGWVRNLSDGRVEAVFEGEKARVQELIKWLWQGPAGAEVSHVDLREEKYRGEFRRFEIIH